MEKISSLNQRKNDLQKEIKELAVLVGNKTRLKLEIPELIAKKEAIQNELLTLNDQKQEIQKNNEELVKIKNEVSVKKKDLDQLNLSHKQELDKKTKEIQSQQAVLDDWVKKISDKKSEFSKLEADLGAKRQENAKNIRQMKEEYDKLFAEMKISVEKLENDFKAYETVRKDALEAREGECSKREDRLNCKQEQLKQLLADLEKYYNRSFPHIKF